MYLLCIIVYVESRSTCDIPLGEIYELKKAFMAITGIWHRLLMSVDEYAQLTF